jgi:hypothetical protein
MGWAIGRAGRMPVWLESDGQCTVGVPTRALRGPWLSGGAHCPLPAQGATTGAPHKLCLTAHSCCACITGRAGAGSERVRRRHQPGRRDVRDRRVQAQHVHPHRARLRVQRVHRHRTERPSVRGCPSRRVGEREWTASHSMTGPCLATPSSSHPLDPAGVGAGAWGGHTSGRTGENERAENGGK